MLKNLTIYTNKFPYLGGETFLETEIHYLAGVYDKILVVPMEQGDAVYGELPENVEILKFDFNKPVSTKKIVKSYFLTLLHWFITEFVKSPFRFKYFSMFKFNLYELLGKIDTMDRFYNENKMQILGGTNYCYWFNEWASVFSLMKHKDFRVNFMVRVHLYDFEEEFYQRGYIPFRYKEMAQPDKIVAISQYGLNYLNKKWPVHSKKYALSRLGVNNLGNNPVKDERDPLIIVSCSNLSAYKRPLVLAKVMKELRSEIVWHHFGDGDLKKEFLAETDTLPSNIKFIFHGYLPNKEIIEFYKTHPVAAVLNVSEYEGIPVSLMEAISFGIPVIGCNVCGIPELVNAQTGLLLEASADASEMAKQIELFINKKCVDLAFREGVKIFWADYYDADTNYKNFIKNVLID